MKNSELRKKLEAKGMIFYNGGNHDHYYYPKNKKAFIVVGRHYGQEVGTGLAASILKQADRLKIKIEKEERK